MGEGQGDLGPLTAQSHHSREVEKGIATLIATDLLAR